ncbi:hypothetical protein NDU88_006066 [Pleurodeles waltl]|uniref:Uncharacterized protein n=1 Tax=Pleurodeles waltl TaxID=8319 RepID=A0AAV7MCD7_PLEWA|nr:hypothetical protein NDU88_006066 [Pleurodeles waltl]
MGARRSYAAPSKEQATKERERTCAEVELRAGSPTPSVGSVEQQDKDPPVLDVEQIQVILGRGPSDGDTANCRRRDIRRATPEPQGAHCSDPT